MIPADEIRRALDRLLASETFARSERGRKLLAYLVEKQQSGEGERLKGFSIAMDVFGKDADFDPSTDAVVRVQAGRLRDLLGQYYLTEGIHEHIRIEIPRGAYAPSYRLRSVPQADKPELFDSGDAAGELDAAGITAALASQFGDPKNAGRMPAARAAETVPVQNMILRHVRLFWVALAVMIAMLGFVASRVGSNTPETAIAANETTGAVRGHRGAATRELLPSVYLESKDGGDLFVQKIVGLLHRALPRFDTIDYAANQHAPDGAGEAGATQFVIRVSPGQAAGEALLEVESAATERVLYSKSLRSDDPMPLDDTIASALTAVLPASGVVYAYIGENGLQSSVTDCMIMENTYYNDQKTENHETAYRCFEELVNRYAKSPLVWAEIAALELEAFTDKYAYPPDASLDRAVRYARRAIELGPNSAVAYRSNGYVLMRAGSRDEGIRWTSQAAALNPYDLTLSASAGYNLVFAGEFAKGSTLLSRAVGTTQVHPQWWDYALFGGLLAEGSNDDAYKAADALAGSSRTLYMAARLVAAAGRGQADEAAALAAAIREKNAKFADDPMAAFTNAKYPEGLAKAFAEGLAKAGIGPAS